MWTSIYFEDTIAKAILFRTSEKLYSVKAQFNRGYAIYNCTLFNCVPDEESSNSTRSLQDMEIPIYFCKPQADFVYSHDEY